MPAINLPRLRKQVNDLAPYCSEPEVFLRKFKDLLDFYGDRTLRPSQASARHAAISSANVPPQVLRQVVITLTPYAASTPHLIFDLGQELWKYAWLDHRLLACDLIGKLPASYAPEILQLAEAWCMETHEEVLLSAIAGRSLAALHTDHQDLLLDKVRHWISAPETLRDSDPALPPAVLLNLQKLGLQALLPLISSPAFENLPRLFNLLKPTLQDPPKGLRPDLVDVLRRLGRRTPQETAFYLRSLHADSPSATLIWLIRRSLNAFPENLQPGLREMIKPAKPPLN